MAENEKIAQFIITNSALFHSKDGEHAENKLYFLADTEEIYRGDVPFTTGIIFYSRELPELPAKRKLYINEETLNGYTWENNEWKSVITQYKIVSEINPNVNTTDIPNVEALRSFIRSAISDITYNSDDFSLNFTIDNIPRKTVIGGMLSSAKYDRATNYLTFNSADGNEAFRVKLPKDNFPVSGYYDDTLKCIVFKMKANDVDEEPYELKIPVEDLLEIQLSKVDGNILKKYDDGYGVVLDVSGKMDKVSSGEAGRIITANEDGNADATNKFLGGAHFKFLDENNTQASADVVATEAGVMELVNDLNQNLETLRQYKIVQIIDKDNPDSLEYPSEVAIVNLYTEISQSIEKIRELVIDIGNSSDSNNQNVESLRISLNALSAQLNALEVTVNSFQNNIDEIPIIKETLNTHSNRMDDISGTVSTNSSNIINLTNNLQLLQEQLATVNTDLQDSKKSINEEIQLLNNAIDNLMTVQTTIESKFANQINTVTGYVDSVKKALEDFQDETAFRYFL